MADEKISELTPDTDLIDTDIVPLVDITAGVTKYMQAVIFKKVAHGEIYAYENTVATTVSVQNTWYQLTGFSANGQSFGTTPDHTNDHITIDQTGIYLVKVSLTATGSAPNKTYQFMVKKNNGATNHNNLASGILFSTAGVRRALSISGLASFTQNDTIELWVKGTDALPANITSRFSNLSVVRIA